MSEDDRKKTKGQEFFHEEVEIEDFEYDEDEELYHYPCPCGDRFEITKVMLEQGEDIATCPSCSLVVRVIYDIEMFVQLETLSLSETTKAVTDPV